MKCEIAGCDHAASPYFVFGRAVSSSPFNMSTNSPPQVRRVLCREHALEQVGTSFGSP